MPFKVHVRVHTQFFHCTTKILWWRWFQELPYSAGMCWVYCKPFHAINKTSCSETWTTTMKVFDNINESFPSTSWYYENHLWFSSVKTISYQGNKHGSYFIWEILSFHCGLLGYDAMLSYRWLNTRLHGIITHTITIQKLLYKLNSAWKGLIIVCSPLL